jgi:hypothetical protein
MIMKHSWFYFWMLCSSSWRNVLLLVLVHSCRTIQFVLFDAVITGFNCWALTRHVSFTALVRRNKFISENLMQRNVLHSVTTSRFWNCILQMSPQITPASSHLPNRQMQSSLLLTGGNIFTGLFLIVNIQISQPECKSSVVRDAPTVGFQYSEKKKRKYEKFEVGIKHV